MVDLQFDILFENSAAANVVVDESFLIQRVNRRFCEWAGLAKEQIEGRINLITFVVPDERPAAQERFMSRRAGLALPEDLEITGLTRLGERKRIRVRYIPMPGTPLTIYSVLDIGHELAREQLNAKYDNLLELCGTSILVIDEEASILYGNHRLQELIGYEPRDLVGKWKVTELLTPASRDLAEARLQMWLTDEENYNWQETLAFQAVAKDGRLVDVLALNSLIPGTREIMLSIMDVTQERTLDERLKRERLQRQITSLLVDLTPETRESLLQQISTITCQGFAADGCVIGFNTVGTTEAWGQGTEGRAFDLLRAMTAQVSRPIDLELGANTDPTLAPLFERMRSAGAQRVVVEHMKSHQGRTSIGIRFDKVTDWSPEDRLLLQSINLVVANGLDRLEVERLRIENERMVLQNQKMESIGIMAGGIAHDFNNMLSAIIGNGELALALGDDMEATRESVTDLLDVAERARQLVYDLQAFSRQSELVLSPLDLRKVVYEAERIMRASMPASIAIRTRFPDAPMAVLGDSNQLLQVLVNLATNAQHAMGRAGELFISIDFHIAGPSDHQELVRDKDYVRLLVEDTGPGIPPEIVGQIFDPFFTTKEIGEGTGMGLATAHGTIRSHGGVIEARNRPEGGACIAIHFPALEGWQPANDQQTFRPTRRTVSPQTRRVMLIDDEPDVLNVIQKILEAAGFEVLAFHVAQDALDAFHKDPEEIHVVITDMTMPGLSGVEVAVDIKALRPDCPVIVSTGYAVAGTDHPGFDGILQKPYRSDVLIDLLKSVMNTE